VERNFNLNIHFLSLGQSSISQKFTFFYVSRCVDYAACLHTIILRLQYIYIRETFKMSIEQAYSSAEHLLEKRPYISDNDCYLIRLIQVLGNLKYHDIMIKKTCLLSLIRHAILI
jgi:hypothetical protein